MENASEILKELQDISPRLAEVGRVNVYSVEDNYFSNLASAILNRINTGEESKYNFPSATPYKVDEGYFENFSKSLLKKIKVSSTETNEVARELNEIAPFLNKISKTSVYTIPQDYFSALQVPVPQSSKPTAKVVRFSKRITRYASAAVIAGVMAVASYFMIEKKSPSTSNTDNVASAIKNLKDEEIIEFLKTSSAPGSPSNAISETAAPGREIKQQLSEVPDEELQQYLKENSEPGEIEVDI